MGLILFNNLNIYQLQILKYKFIMLYILNDNRK